MSGWNFKKKKPITAVWPKNENGDPVPPVFLEHASGGPVDVELVTNLLEAYGIPAVTQLPLNGEFAQVIMGMTGTGVDIYVPETLLEDAQNILSADIIEDAGADE